MVRLLFWKPGRSRAPRATHDPPCRECGRHLQYEAAARRWQCPWLPRHYGPTALAAMCLEAERRARQLQRGIPRATALLLRAADAGAR